jgi:hypothetical protein
MNHRVDHDQGWRNDGFQDIARGERELGEANREFADAARDRAIGGFFGGYSNPIGAMFENRANAEEAAGRRDQREGYRDIAEGERDLSHRGGWFHRWFW